MKKRLIVSLILFPILLFGQVLDSSSTNLTSGILKFGVSDMYTVVYTIGQNNIDNGDTVVIVNTTSYGDYGNLNQFAFPVTGKTDSTFNIFYPRDDVYGTFGTILFDSTSLILDLNKMVYHKTGRSTNYKEHKLLSGYCHTLLNAGSKLFAFGISPTAADPSLVAVFPDLSNLDNHFYTIVRGNMLNDISGLNDVWQMFGDSTSPLMPSYQGVYVQGKNQIYIISNNDIISFDVNNYTSRSIIYSDFMFRAGGSITSDGSYLYALSHALFGDPNGNYSIIYKYSLTDYSLTQQVSLTGCNQGHSIIYDGANLYATGNNNITPGDGEMWIAKISPSDLTYTIQKHTGIATDDMAYSNDYVLVGIENVAKVRRFLKSNLAINDTIILPYGSYVMASNGGYIYSGAKLNPYLSRIKYADSSLSVVRVETQKFSYDNSSINELQFVGDNFLFTNYPLSSAFAGDKTIFDQRTVVQIGGRGISSPTVLSLGKTGITP